MRALQNDYACRNQGFVEIPSESITNGKQSRPLFIHHYRTPSLIYDCLFLVMDAVESGENRCDQK